MKKALMVGLTLLATSCMNQYSYLSLPKVDMPSGEKPALEYFEKHGGIVKDYKGNIIGTARNQTEFGKIIVDYFGKNQWENDVMYFTMSFKRSYMPLSMQVSHPQDGIVEVYKDPGIQSRLEKALEGAPDFPDHEKVVPVAYAIKKDGTIEKAYILGRVREQAWRSKP